MAGFKSSFLDKILGRIDRLDTEGLQSVVQRLEEQRQFFETVFNVIEDGILVVNWKGRIQYCNQAAGELLGVDARSMDESPVSRLIPEFQWEHFISSVSHEPSPGMVRLEFSLSYPKTRFLRLYGAAIEQQEVDESSYVLVLHDATETRKQTVEAIESERIHTLTLLAGSVAHEIGNPLNALHIHLQLIGREAAKVREMFSQQPPPPKRGRGRPPKAQAETPNPAAIDHLYQHWQADDADTMQQSLNDIRDAVMVYPMIPALKATVAEFSGDDAWRTVRPPLVALDGDSSAKLAESLRGQGFEMPGL